MLLAFSLFNAMATHAQKMVPSSKSAAGFSFSATASGDVDKPVQPVIIYQQNISMLSGIADRPSMHVFGDGRVEVHHPAYMKTSGDYVMQLTEAELVDLIQSLSENGVLDFDEDKVKTNIRSKKKELRKSGQLYAVSDVVETVIEVRLDDYQKNNSAKRKKDFHKRFQWKNIEHDARRFKQQREIVDANQSAQSLKGLMKDKRLAKQGR